jgi:hypothetical protein
MHNSDVGLWGNFRLYGAKAGHRTYTRATTHACITLLDPVFNNTINLGAMGKV